MNAFEFVFSLFGLLLGFSLVEVLAGFVRTVKARRKVRLGWLTPLLGIFVMFHLASFWSDAWELRDLIPATDRSMFVGLALAGLYYFAASMVFPEKAEDWEDLDLYFFEVKRAVLGVVLACDFLSWLVARALRGETWVIDDLIGLAITAAFILFAVLVKGKWLNLFILLLLIVPMIGWAMVRG